jgi:ABC-type multidrug transport system ATPase subunit
MGFRAKRKVIVLQFADDLEGLEVRARSQSMAELLDLTDQIALLESGGLAALSKVRGLITEFAEHLESWNLEDEDGVPVPMTAEAVLEQDPGMVIEMVLAWAEGVVTIRKSDPLDPSSTNGTPSALSSVPMVSTSASLAS